nr:hypothetical protein [Sphingomonas sp.]
MATFNGTPGNDIFTGGGDSDTAAGNGGDDNLSGGGSDDFLSGGAGADTIDGGDGNDWLYGGEQSPPFNIFTTPPTYPLLDTGSDRDTLIGGAGSDAIFAGYGDTVDGGADSDSLLISFLGAPSGITFDMHLATQTIGGATITSIENLVWVQGSNFNDYIDANPGSYGDAVLYGMGGNDTLIGSYYSALLDGGDGTDIVDGRNSLYLRGVYGGAGDDIVYSNSSAPAYGGDGNDTIYAGGEVHGGTGNDQIVMQYSYYGARVYGEEGDDVITAASSSNIIGGGSGADTLNGNSGNDSLGSANFVPGTYSGAQFDDDMGLEHDVLAGLDGNDLLAIGYGDSADGGTGSDTLRLSLGGLSAGVTFSTAGVVSGQPYTLGGGTIQNIETLAYLRGTDFNDTLTLVTQSTLLTVNAGSGDDLIFSQNSSVALNGGDGNDRFVSGPAGDSFDGGNGIDTIDYQLATAGITVNLSLNSAFGNGAGGDQLVNVENVFGSTFGDTLTGNDLANELRGQAGDDVLNGGGGADTLDGGAGADTMSGGSGDDLYIVDVAGDQVTESADEGRDLVLSGISYSLTANVEDLTLAGETAIDGTGNGLGNTLIGNAAANALSGLGGNDVLTGAAGADTLTGGSGNDLFRDSTAGLNGDTITDFSVGDRIIITDADVSGFQFNLTGHTLTYSGGSLTLDTITAGTIVAHAAAGGGVELSIATLVAPAGHAGDFNGDHRDDLMWRNDNGALTDWLGTTAGGFTPNGSNLLEVVDTGWQIAGIGDFNGDSRDDVLWRRADGAMTDWLGTPSGGLSPNGA